MKKITLFLYISLFLFTSFSCSTVPVTGRQQLKIIPSSNMLTMSFNEYDQIIKKGPLSENKDKREMIHRVGERIQMAVEDYMREKGLSEKLKGYRWEFNLLESDDVNAWCMPGGKVAVYTGILPIAEDEEGLAVVMGHEVAHAVAEHGNERMSQALLFQMGGAALSKAMEQNPEKTRDLWQKAFGIGTQVGVMLPFSRLHESEADYLGLVFMAMAGYDPNRAVEFWEKMAGQKSKKAPPEFLSTHPADSKRIHDIKSKLPEIINRYKK